MTTADTPTTLDRIDVPAETPNHHRSTTIAATDLNSAAKRVLAHTSRAY
jgi:hypothetical protein